MTDYEIWLKGEVDDRHFVVGAHRFDSLLEFFRAVRNRRYLYEELQPLRRLTSHYYVAMLRAMNYYCGRSGAEQDRLRNVNRYKALKKACDELGIELKGIRLDYDLINDREYINIFGNYIPR